MKTVAIPFLITTGLIICTFLFFSKLEIFFTVQLKQYSSHASTYSLVSFIILVSDIVLPVPSSIVMFTNGYVLGWVGGATVSFISVLVSSTIGYYLGKFTSMALNSKQRITSNQILLKYGSLAILLSRGVPVISESVCIVCGYNRVSFRFYFLLNIIGYVPVCLLYAFFGNFGYKKNIFFISFISSLLISGAFWFLGKEFSKNQKPKFISN